MTFYSGIHPSSLSSIRSRHIREEFLVGNGRKISKISINRWRFVRDANHLLPTWHSFPITSYFFFSKGVVQTIQEEFDYNGESNLDLQYAMNLVNLVGSKQDVILYQVGDIPQGLHHFIASFSGNELTPIIIDRGISQ